ncbi:MAG: efflux RND transporter periplasmic adaptor subunit [Gammaproteobacteria bacterium]|nr:efflux RND transporter periplasmic adaptor subunit [Gammaproteobacteria bacterium]
MNRYAKAFALLAALPLAGCRGGAADEGGGEADPADDAFLRVVNVEVQPLAATDFTQLVQVTGTVRANRDVTVSAEEAGVVREILAEEGAAVAAGDPLIRIDDSILRSQVAEAEARATLAGETWERRRRLFEEDGVGSELAYLEARYQSEQASAGLAALRERLARTTVTAPIPGILERREVEIGAMVSPGAPVARIVEIDPVRVTGGVPERYAADVKLGSEAVVRFDVLTGEEYGGSVDYVGATVNPRNRTFEAELQLPNPGLAIKPEMVANIEILTGTIPGAIVVPQESLVRAEDGFVAFVVGSNGSGAEVAELREVTLGPSQRDQVVVEEGLLRGDRLIVLGQNLVVGGDRVRVVATRDGVPARGDQ